MTDKPRMVATDIKQSKSHEPDGNGGYGDFVTTHFTTPSGTRTHVKLPAEYHNAENAAAAMLHEMRNIEDVHGLDGQDLEQYSAG